MAAGAFVVIIITGLPNQILELLGMPPWQPLLQIPVVSFPWRIMFGSLTTLAIGLMFKRRVATSENGVS
jgi:hypothetical protein